MIDPELIEGNDLAKRALVMLAESGILREQQEALRARIGFGDAEESDEKILEAIKRLRRESALLESLQQFGEQIKAEGVPQ